MKKQYISQWRKYLYYCVAHYRRNRNENRQHRNPSIIWARRTFWVVLFYTAATFALLIVNWRVARIAGDTEERQLRAYVFPDHVQIHNTSKTSDAAPKLEIQIKNTGITPAYHVISLVGGKFLPFPSEVGGIRLQPGPGVMKIASVFYLPNGGVAKASANVDGALVPLTAEQKRLLGDGSAAIYLYGYRIL